MKKYRNEFPIEKMAFVLKVSRSGYYKYLKKGASERSKENERLKDEIINIFEESRETYGSIRIHKELKNRRIQCGKNKVAFLMNVMELMPKTQKKYKVRTTNSNHKFPISDNLLNRNFIVSKANKVWVSDITYVQTDEGWLYLCVVLDLYSRMIVGWSMQDNLRTELVIDALDMAYMNRKPDKGLIFHSDRGSQYASYRFRENLEKYGMKSSMSRKGDCWDNACAESLFGTIKSELIYSNNYSSHEEVKKDVFEYIEVFYNRKRRHSTLNYLSPFEFEHKKVA